MINNKKLFSMVLVGLLFCSPLGMVQGVFAADDKIINLFAADSLRQPIEQFITQFEKDHDGVKINLTCKGSNGLVNDILNGVPADILLSADVGLIDQRLIPKYTGWNGEFLTNSMVIAYRNDSVDSNQINANNWFKILGQGNIKFGLGNPNNDPGGYRAVMMIQLANNYYGDNNIFDNLIASHSTITSEKNSVGCTIYSPTNNKAQYPLVIDNDSDLSMQSLQNNNTDYAIVYKSLAAQYQEKDSNIEYIDLPGPLALNDNSYDYSGINLIENSDNDSSKKTGSVKF
jgi:molybdate/tungstate transport system substrate-binding protein